MQYDDNIDYLLLQINEQIIRYVVREDVDELDDKVDVLQ